MIFTKPLKKNLFYRKQLLVPFNIYRLYEVVAKAYSRDKPKFRDDLISRPLIVELANILGFGKDIIDVGCGDGHISRLISPLARKLVGVDISESMLAEARLKSRFFKNVDFIKFNFLNLNLLNQKFDLALGVFAFCCVQNSQELDLAFRNIYYVLRKGGHAIIQIPNDRELLSETRSEWIAELPYSNDAVGQLIGRKLKTVDNEWVDVARYHYRLQEYIESIKKAAFKIEQIIEPTANSELLKKYPSLKHEAEVASSIIIILKK